MDDFDLVIRGGTVVRRPSSSAPTWA